MHLPYQPAMPKQLSLPKYDSLQRLRLLALGACASASLLALGTPAEAAPTYKARTLATGLESPRGVAIAPNGNLVLSEAGRGGNGACLTGGSGNSVCYGTTGPRACSTAQPTLVPVRSPASPPWRGRTLLCMTMQPA